MPSRTQDPYRTCARPHARLNHLRASFSTTVQPLGLAGVLVAALAIPNASVMASSVVFVSAGGSDANACTSSKPCASIGHAISVAGGNATVLVGSGT